MVVPSGELHEQPVYITEETARKIIAELPQAISKSYDKDFARDVEVVLDSLPVSRNELLLKLFRRH